MEKYTLESRGHGKIESVCYQSEIGCSRLEFKDKEELFNFLKRRISNFEDFRIDSDGIDITWHEKNGDTHNVRNARINFGTGLDIILYDDIFNIYHEYRRYREAVDFLKARCQEELLSHEEITLNSNGLMVSYIDLILRIYASNGKVETLFDEMANKHFLNLLETNQEIFIHDDYKKATIREREASNKWNKKVAIFSAILSVFSVIFITLPLSLVVALLGSLVIGSIYVYKMVRLHNTNLDASRKKTHDYANFVKDFKSNIKDAKNKKIIKEEEFYSFIKQDVDYMNAHYCEEYERLLLQINQLQESFAKNVSEQKVDISEYLLALAYLEVEIYSKEKGIGLKSVNDCPLCRETILRRLNLLGIKELTVYERDPHLVSLLDSVDIITKMPFFGYAEELARLNRIAIDYVVEALKHVQQTVPFDVSKIDDVVQEGQNEVSVVAKKVQTAKKYKELCDLLDDLDAHLTVDPKMNTDKEISLPL